MTHSFPTRLSSDLVVEFEVVHRGQRFPVGRRMVMRRREIACELVASVVDAAVQAALREVEAFAVIGLARGQRRGPVLRRLPIMDDGIVEEMPLAGDRMSGV